MRWLRTIALVLGLWAALATVFFEYIRLRTPTGVGAAMGERDAAMRISKAERGLSMAANAALMSLGLWLLAGLGENIVSRRKNSTPGAALSQIDGNDGDSEFPLPLVLVEPPVSSESYRAGDAGGL